MIIRLVSCRHWDTGVAYLVFHPRPRPGGNAEKDHLDPGEGLVVLISQLREETLFP